ncbi:MAG: DNA lyase [Candidatus Margulisiibacteriota bacterium]|nr:MAG: DNA lyase [Candidatus Margulisbacteria bacterium GWD2_39_127]PZM78398.1 MAG: DNA lyase [Candidatus Margulisiibacteriota bacterium]HAR62369.1 DNA lyase [Candidatus Margulisiibacteriota bacterium]HCY36567.1 DNA lyase [Candidatus Margulisiibacteriota bacterium]
MRLWSLHPGYLDSKGLVALWREGLLAQNVLQGNTKSYKNHPQLIRFKHAKDPVGAIASFLRGVADEADIRGYRFNRRKIVNQVYSGKILVTSGQVDYEFNRLLGKLKDRAPSLYEQLKMINRIETHPLFKKITGDVEPWEVIKH